VKTWQALLRKVRSVGREQYGPHTKEIGAMIIALQEAQWYANVRKPSPLDAQVIRVGSWKEAWSILEDPDPDRYTSRGLLDAPTSLLEGLRVANEAENAWWKAARQLVIEAVQVKRPPAPAGPMQRLQDLASDRIMLEAIAGDYLYDTLDRILEEIILADHTDCTYFREQLQWLAAGYFPCGWDGRWPEGRMRVL